MISGATFLEDIFATGGVDVVKVAKITTYQHSSDKPSFPLFPEKKWPPTVSKPNVKDTKCSMTFTIYN